MVGVIHKGTTVLDYLNLLMTWFEAENNPVDAISFNRFEWVQFVTLLKMNHENCQAFASLTEPTSGKYKDTLVFYDGTENDSDEYKFHAQDLHNRLEERRRLNTTPPQDGIATPEPETATNRYINTVRIAAGGYIEPARTGRARAVQGNNGTVRAAQVPLTWGGMTENNF